MLSYFMNNDVITHMELQQARLLHEQEMQVMQQQKESEFFTTWVGQEDSVCI